MNRRYRSRLAVSKKSVMRWGILFFFLASAVFTYVLMSNTAQFYVVNQQLLNDPEFIQTDHYWKHSPNNVSIVSYSGKSITIENSRLASNQVVQKLTVNSPLFLRLSVEAGGKGIVTDKQSFGGGGVAAVLYGKDGDRLKKNSIVVIKKSMPTRTYSEIFYVDKKVDSVSVALRLLRAEGVFTVQNPELSVLAEFPAFKTTRTILAVFWCFLGIWLICWAVRNLPFNSLVVPGGLSFVVVVGVLMPGGSISAFNQSFFSVLPDGIAVTVEQLLTFFFGSAEPKPPTATLSKFGHFLVFFFIGVLAGRACRKFGVVYGIALVVVFAVATEALQTLVFGRSTSLRDVYIDSIGGVLGLLFAITFIFINEKFKNRAELI